VPGPSAEPPLPPDHLPGWETLFLATEITRCLGVHRPPYEAWLAGGSTPSLVLEADPTDDLRDRDAAMVSIIEGIEPLFSTATLAEALGVPGVPGDEATITALAGGIGAAFGALVDWASSTRGAEAPAGWAEAYRALAQIAAGPLRQIWRFGEEFSAAASGAVAHQRAGGYAGSGIEMRLMVAISDEDVAAFSRALEGVPVARIGVPDAGGVDVERAGRRRHLLRWMLAGALIATVLSAAGLLG